MSEASADISVTRENDVTVVTVQTENLLGITDVNRLGSQLSDLLARGDTKLVVDLAMVKYAGSAALGMLLSIDQQLKLSQGKLILAAAEKLEGLLKVSRTRGVFALATDVQAAVRQF
jgi:anti-anti-sigma factor